MGRKHTPGLYKRRGFWHIDKRLFGRRVCKNTGTGSLEEAEKYLARIMEQMRAAEVFGIRPARTFREVAKKYLRENMHKTRINDDAMHIAQLDNYIGTLPLNKIHNGTLAPFIAARQKQGRKSKTINLALGVVRHMLNLAAHEWMDESGLTWLAQAPKIKMLPVRDARKPYPLSWDEQTRLFAELPLHLRRMALFKVNTGCREQEVCQLRWEWEVPIPELNTSVFIIPGWLEVELPSGKKEWRQFVKNGENRLIVLNDIAKGIIDSVREDDPEFVFTYQYKSGCRRPVTGINNSAWKRAREKVGLPQVRVHDLKHTFGHRLRFVGVSYQDIKDLLGHKSREITTHYSSAEVENLIKAANKVCGYDQQKAPLAVLRLNSRSLKMRPRFSSSANLPPTG